MEQALTLSGFRNLNKTLLLSSQEPFQLDFQKITKND